MVYPEVKPPEAMNYAPLEFETPICVTAHDAGAANLIAGIVRSISQSDIRLAVAGPAEQIFRKELPLHKNLELSIALHGARTLLSGTSSSQSNLEHRAREIAARAGIRSIGVIDHWVNYSERFRRDNNVLLPSEIWVADEYALQTARTAFPNAALRIFRNRYLEDILSQVPPPEPPKGPDEPRVLYVLEPIRETWKEGPLPGEFQALNFFMESLPKLYPGKNPKIHLRPHPSEPIEKYRKWALAHQTQGVSLGEPVPLPEAIGWADVVAGCESYAMVIALSAGRRILCTIPPWGHRCRLPHRGIEFLTELLK